MSYSTGSSTVMTLRLLLLSRPAQRLVRLLCDRCKEPYLAQGTEAAQLGLTGNSQLFRARGCPHCNYSGYRGRTGIYELVVVDEEMRTMIHDNAAQSALERQARRLTPSIIDDGRRRVLAGDTTLEEVLPDAGGEFSRPALPVRHAA